MKKAVTITTSRSQLWANLATNGANFAVSVVVALLFTPYLIRHLGTAAYGMIPLCLILVNYGSIITVATNNSIYRSMTLGLESGDETSSNQIFNTSLLLSLCLAGASLIPSILIGVLSHRVLQIPPGFETEAAFLFACIVGAFVIQTATSPCSAVLFARNRLDLLSLTVILQNLTKVVVVVILFSLAPQTLRHVGIGILCASIVGAASTISICRVLVPSVTISLRLANWATFRRIARTGCWTSLGAVGGILFLSIDLLVVNHMCGPDATGRYAIAVQLRTILRNMAGTLAGVAAPTIIALFGRGSICELVSYARDSIRLLGLTMVAPLGIICGFAVPFLHTWLGKEFVDLAPLVILVVGPLSINLTVLPLFAISLAADAVKLPSLVTLALGMVNVILAVTLVGALEMGTYGVATAAALVLTAKNIVFTPVYTARVIGRPWGTFIWPIVTTGLAATVLAASAWQVAQLIELHSWFSLFVAGGFVALGYFAAVYMLLLNKMERNTMSNMARDMLSRATQFAT